MEVGKGGVPSKNKPPLNDSMCADIKSDKVSLLALGCKSRARSSVKDWGENCTKASFKKLTNTDRHLLFFFFIFTIRGKKLRLKGGHKLFSGSRFSVSSLYIPLRRRLDALSAPYRTTTLGSLQK